MTNLHRGHWKLEPGLDFLNHGSFGACPRPVLRQQQALRDELERQPVEFLARQLPGLLDAARERVAAFLGADPAGLVATSNATSSINAVLRSFELSPGDELVVTDHEYNACRNALDFAAERSGARVVVARIPFPIESPSCAVDAVLSAVSDRTRLVLLDHVTSPTGLILPVESLTSRLAERGIDTLIDGAHAPGMLPLDLETLACSFYVGNLHKWVCAPKGAAFLYVGAAHRHLVRPLVISHGANTPRPGRSRLHDEFDWTGTRDPTAFLCVPTAIDFLGSLLDGGLDAVRSHNRDLARRGREILCSALGVEPPCPEEMLGSLASVRLPDGAPGPAASALYTDPLQEALLRNCRIEVPIIAWPAPPRRLLRISAQLYNDVEQYRRLGDALTELFAS